MSTDRALYEKMYAAQLAEGHDLETAMRYNKAATPEDFLRAFGQSSDPRHQHRKWGGGNKMGSGGAAVNAARRARAEARRSAPDANVNNYTNKNLADRLGLTALSNFVDSRVNDVQGKFMPSNPSFGFSQKTLNEAGARGADSSFAGDIGGSVYGVSPANSFFIPEKNVFRVTLIPDILIQLTASLSIVLLPGTLSNIPFISDPNTNPSFVSA